MTETGVSMTKLGMDWIGAVVIGSVFGGEGGCGSFVLGSFAGGFAHG